MMHSRDFTRIPRAAILAAVTALVLGYIPLTGLDHLHLHVEDEHTFAHDHLNVGHHEHGHHHDHHDKAPENDGSDPSRRDSHMVTFAQAVQVRPAPVLVQILDTVADERPWIDTEPIRRAVDPHPSWSSRAPPS